MIATNSTTNYMGTFIIYGFVRRIMCWWEKRKYKRLSYMRFLPRYIQMKTFTEQIERQFARFYLDDWIDACVRSEVMMRSIQD